MNKNEFKTMIDNMNEEEFEIFKNIISTDICLKRSDIIEDFVNETGSLIVDVVESVIDILEEV